MQWLEFEKALLQHGLTIEGFVRLAGCHQQAISLWKIRDKVSPWASYVLRVIDMVDTDERAELLRRAASKAPPRRTAQGHYMLAKRYQKQLLNAWSEWNIWSDPSVNKPQDALDAHEELVKAQRIMAGRLTQMENASPAGHKKAKEYRHYLDTHGCGLTPPPLPKPRSPSA